MKESFLLRKRVAVLQIAILVLSVVTPVFMFDGNVRAAQLGDRSITINSSAPYDAGSTLASPYNGDDVLYTLSFVTSSTASLDGLVLDFCSTSDSPIIGDACTGPAGFDIETGVSLGTQTGTGGNDFTIDTTATSTADNRLILDRTASSISSGTTIVIPIIGVRNPSDLGTFYARLLTYDNGGQDTYTSISPGTHVDDGGFALSTAAQILLTARVQESLTFCVGNTDADAAGTCADISGTDVDLGVLDPTQVNYASDTEAIGAGKNINDGSAYARVSTNAQRGATVQYHADELQTPDSIIDAAGATETTITAGTERWGLTVKNIDTSDGGTTNLVRATDYDNDVGYAFAPNTPTVLASSGAGAAAENRVLDNEQLEIDIAATVAATTPTGLYTTSISFIATGTF